MARTGMPIRRALSFDPPIAKIDRPSMVRWRITQVTKTTPTRKAKAQGNE